MKFNRIMNKVFSVLFGVLAIAEMIGVFTGRPWCLIMAVPMAGLSVFLWKNARKLKTRRR